MKSAYELSPLPKPTTKEEAKTIVLAEAELAESLRAVRKITKCKRENYPGQERLKQVARNKGYRGLANSREWGKIDWTPSLRKGASATAPMGKVVSFSEANTNLKRPRNTSATGRSHL